MWDEEEEKTLKNNRTQGLRRADCSDYLTLFSIISTRLQRIFQKSAWKLFHKVCFPPNPPLPIPGCIIKPIIEEESH